MPSPPRRAHSLPNCANSSSIARYAPRKSRAHRQVELSAAELASAEAQAKRLEAAVKTLRPIVASRLVDLCKLGRPGCWRMLLSVDDLQSVGRTFRTVSAIVQQDRARVDRYTRTLAALADTKSTLAKRAEAAAGTRAAGASCARHSIAVSHSLRGWRRSSAADLNAQLTGELQEAARRPLQASVGGLSADRPVLAMLPVAPFRGDLPWPASGVARSALTAAACPLPPPSSGTAFSSASRKATGRAPCTKGASRSQVHSPAALVRRRTWRGDFALSAFAACGCARRYGRAPGGTRRDGTHPSRRPRYILSFASTARPWTPYNG